MEVKTCSIMYNASVDLLKINLQDNYKFKKRFLSEQTLLTFFDETPMGLRRKYQQACLDEDLTIITVESDFNVSEQEISELDYEQPFELKLLKQLDRQIRLIRLVCDCTLHFSEFRYTLTSSENRTIGTIPHIDRVIWKTNEPFSINDSQLDLIQNCFANRYPFINDWVYKVYDFFDSSFLFNDEKALVILITAFEMVFLKRDRCQKKEILARRSAVYFGNSDEEIKEIYKKMKLCYSTRSNYVHEGKSIQNSDNEVHFLRNLLRKFILNNKDNHLLTKNSFKQAQISKVKNCLLFPPITCLEEPPINTNPYSEGKFQLWWHHLFAKPIQHIGFNDLRKFYWNIDLGDNLTVDVYIDEWSYLRPHFHLIGENFHTILRLDKPKYYNHGYSIGFLNNNQVTNLYEWIYAHYKNTSDNAWNTMAAHWNFSKNTYYKVKSGLFPNYKELLSNG